MPEEADEDLESLWSIDKARIEHDERAQCTCGVISDNGIFASGVALKDVEEADHGWRLREKKWEDKCNEVTRHVQRLFRSPRERWSCRRIGLPRYDRQNV
jgi:hypothetical protein